MTYKRWYTIKNKETKPTLQIQALNSPKPYNLSLKLS